MGDHGPLAEGSDNGHRGEFPGGYSCSKCGSVVVFCDIHLLFGQYAAGSGNAGNILRGVLDDASRETEFIWDTTAEFFEYGGSESLIVRGAGFERDPLDHGYLFRGHADWQARVVS